MGIVSTLKWLWDPRDDETKALSKWMKTTPMQRRTQDLMVYIRDCEKPLICEFSKSDVEIGDYQMRIASDAGLFRHYLDNFLESCGTKGIKIDNIWYSPESIVRIELGEQHLEEL